MASMTTRLANTLRTCRTVISAKTLTSSTSLPALRPQFLHSRIFESQECTLHKATQINSTNQTYIPAILAGLLGIGSLDVAYAESDEVSPETPIPKESSPVSKHNELEDLAKKERQRIQELVKKKDLQTGSFPRFTVAVKGQKIAIKFKVPPTCELPLLIANLVSHLGVNHGSGSDMIVRAWDSGVAWQLTFSLPHKQDETGNNSNKEGLCVIMFRPLISSDRPEIEFMKQGSLSDEELEVLVSVLKLAGQIKNSGIIKPKGSISQPEKTIASLEAMGVKIYGLNEANSSDSENESDISWDNIAGYNQQKREVEDTILLALKCPEVYDDIARGTRCKFETNRPRAVLFEGPPGTGKTSCARVIANQAGVPLVYVPLEVIMSKFYGESERLLGKVFSLANELENGAIVFLDEVDSFAVARDAETHEATRRILSVLLRQIDGFEQEKKVVVVAATNRKQDLDPALISRFDSMITFGLPDHETRQEIAAQYAKHLTKSELSEFASATEQMSGRDIRDVCQQAERHWASKLIRGKVKKDEKLGAVPPIQEYVESALNRQKALANLAEQIENSKDRFKKPQM